MSVQLARRWRSKNFDEIVGQELAVRLLRNTLFKQYFLPVYLFSGLRGSGKTSLARIFAAAVNCAQLDQFSQNPKITVPCGQCASCQAAVAGKHPDIIEIDAASHTGVDNIRSILESASFLPSLGRKRVYIIDEVHMLSRAAFNACLKVFEEPPAHVLFILATTDPEKIIDTIMSRSFQIFFDPIPTPELVKRLAYICDHEKISYDIDGLTMIAEHAEGSLRDALSSLESVWLAQDNVFQGAVEGVLGGAPRSAVIGLSELIMQKNSNMILELFEKQDFKAYSPVSIHKLLVEIMYDIFLLSHDVVRNAYPESWQALARTVPAQQALTWVSMLCDEQPALLKLAILRMVIGQEPMVASTPVVKHVEPVPDDQRQWVTIVKHVLEKAHEPMARALLSASRFKQFENNIYTVQFLKEHELFREWVDTLHDVITRLVHESHPGCTVQAEFTLTGSKSTTGISARAAHQPPVIKKSAPIQEKKNYSEHINQALKLFPGTVSEL